MKRLLLVLVFGSSVLQLAAQNIYVNEPVRMLALGDSYTIGQSVAADERWPVQFLSRLQDENGITDSEVDIIARTGWNTINLGFALDSRLDTSKKYNLVSLLIGVNNQFQGIDIDVYREDFAELLREALALVNNEPNRVFVVSIPDYAYTPSFAGSTSISREIDSYNQVNRTITEEYGVPYVDITPISRRGLLEPALVANDGLHPSGIQYGRWVVEIMKSVEVVSFPVGTNDLVATGAAGSSLPFAFFRGNELVFHSPVPEARIRIMDLSGRVILTRRLPEGVRSVSLPSFTPGLYLIRLEDDLGRQHHTVQLFGTEIHR